MRTVARPSFHKNLVYVKLLLMLMLVAIQLGLLQTPAYATAWQVWHCDPNTGTSLVEATVVDDTNNRELRGDYDSWYVVDADSSPDQSGYADYKATENSTVEVYGDVNVIITDNTKWVAKRIHLNNGAKLTLWSETGNKDIWGKLSVKTTKDHKAALSVGEGSTLVINGCKVDADSDTDDAAGIGGDKNMSAGTIIINDGATLIKYGDEYHFYPDGEYEYTEPYADLKLEIPDSLVFYDGINPETGEALETDTEHTADELKAMLAEDTLPGFNTDNVYVTFDAEGNWTTVERFYTPAQ